MMLEYINALKHPDMVLTLLLIYKCYNILIMCCVIIISLAVVSSHKTRLVSQESGSLEKAQELYNRC